MSEERKPDSPAEEYLEELEEWQRHQYDPGHYLGGKRRHPIFERGRLRRMYGLMLMVGAGLYLLVLIVAILVSLMEQSLSDPSRLLRAGGIMLVVFLIGLMMVRTGKR
ncbi:MAG: hypothetical protein ACOX2K_07630 [Bacillota bacterium]